MALFRVYFTTLEGDKMSRVPMTDGSGSWFNPESSVLFKEDRNFDGRNHISVATGSQWDHESLYYTRSGKWVLHSFSDWQGALDTYEVIEESTAVSWLISNSHQDLNELPESVRTAIEAGFKDAEI